MKPQKQNEILIHIPSFGFCPSRGFRFWVSLMPFLWMLTFGLGASSFPLFSFSESLVFFRASLSSSRIFKTSNGSSSSMSNNSNRFLVTPIPYCVVDMLKFGTMRIVGFKLRLIDLKCATEQNGDNLKIPRG